MPDSRAVACLDFVISMISAHKSGSSIRPKSALLWDSYSKLSQLNMNKEYWIIGTTQYQYDSLSFNVNVIT